MGILPTNVSHLNPISLEGIIYRATDVFHMHSISEILRPGAQTKIKLLLITAIVAVI